MNSFRTSLQTREYKVYFQLLSWFTSFLVSYLLCATILYIFPPHFLLFLACMQDRSHKTTLQRVLQLMIMLCSSSCLGPPTLDHVSHLLSLSANASLILTEVIPVKEIILIPKALNSPLQSQTALVPAATGPRLMWWHLSKMTNVLEYLQTSSSGERPAITTIF